jgi:ATP adenylyltransferase
LVERLWAPWRIRYIKDDKPTGCIFCTKQAEDDDTANHIVWRGERAFVLLNTYPYNNGHLMVVPYDHTGELEELAAEVTSELFSLCQDSVRVLKTTFHPDGINIGVNLGAAAGAGVKDHLHFHLVPRWAGDTNFMSVVSDVRVIPQSLDQAAQIIRGGFDSLNEGRSAV